MRDPLDRRQERVMTETIPVVGVTRNRPHCLEQWLGSVEQQSVPGVTVRPVLVDNGSWDTTPHLLAQAVANRRIMRRNFHSMPINLGFAKAHNHVFRKLLAEPNVKYIATLNEDAYAPPNWLSHLRQAAQNVRGSKIGMWGGPIFRTATSNCKDDTQKLPPLAERRVSSNGHELRAKDASFLDCDWDRPAASVMKDRQSFEPFSPCFAASLWSVAMLKEVGILDNDQFLYYDDVELAFRARMAEWSGSWVREAEAFHPLPRKKETGSRMWRIQQQGRLVIIHRYLPDAERARILSELSDPLRDVLSELKQSGRRLDPEGDEGVRATLWKDWAK